MVRYGDPKKPPLHGLLGLGDHPPPLLELLLVDLADLVLVSPLLCGLGVGQTLGDLLGAALEGLNAVREGSKLVI